MKFDPPLDVSQNIAWTLQNGSFTFHIIITVLVRILYCELIGEQISWPLTILTYNFLTFIFFHWIEGDPFDSRYRSYTFWEQLVEQLEPSTVVAFYTLFPIVLFLIANRLVQWTKLTFYLSFFSLCLVVIPKFRFMNHKRILDNC
ncbi:hypothetical protein TCON_1665 [Astathelohania contejeani]|uniref:Uncharacterized protein n=1 Tax=Astathelohania contejeani TaxID=164912 RepID=A0ABQ7HYA1_9MICR|nr:hypothetical protein TCON_1665 [Thelohania contejeani]